VRPLGKDGLLLTVWKGIILKKTRDSSYIVGASRDATTSVSSPVSPKLTGSFVPAGQSTINQAPFGRSRTQSPAYCSAVKAGTPRIGLDGNVAGEVTLEDEQHALIQMARLARRAAAREAEARKAAAQAVEKRAEQQKPTSEAKSQQPAPAGPPRLGLAGLKAAALKRRQLVAAK